MIDGEAKLIICLIMQKFDNYKDEYKTVSYLLKTKVIFEQHLTKNYTIDDICKMRKSIDVADQKHLELIELLFDDKLVNLIENRSELVISQEIEQKFQNLLLSFERSLRPKEIIKRKGFSTAIL